VIRRILLIVALGWALGLAWFVNVPPRAAGSQETDGVVVLTGGEGRIARGIEVLHKGWATRMLVSGVDSEVTPGEFATEYHIDRATLRCCIALGYHSTDTRSNALEAARWIAAHKLASVRLVTTDWHMRRAAFDLAEVAPPGVTIVEDAVPSKPGLRTLVTEYNKMLARRVAVWMHW
jgi:uncharacterized SAM-binding protein YcdF (DUF218 family)